MSSLAQLRAEALAARAAQEPGRAVHAWRALLDAAPEDWGLALELKHDLKASGRYPDSDPRFRQAARLLPDGEWLAHYSALYAFHAADLDAVDTRARALLGRQPDEPRVHAIRGDVARQRRDWAAAERAFGAAHRLDPAHDLYGKQAAAAGLYDRLARQPWPIHGPRYAVYVVNLDRNADRLVEIRRQFSGSPVPLRRQPGVEGSRLPGAAVHRLTGDPASPRGTLGCFLSHVAAWEALLQSGDSHGLVIEDDVIPLLDLPPALGGLGLPDGFDLCFVNDRLDPGCDADAARTVSVHSLAETMAAFHPEDNAPGADGYLLSREAAAKLLGWVAEDGMAGDIDWRLLAYALFPGEIAGILPHAFARQELQRLQANVGHVERLRAYTLRPALIRTVGVSSEREDQNRMQP